MCECVCVGRVCIGRGVCWEGVLGGVCVGRVCQGKGCIGRGVCWEGVSGEGVYWEGCVLGGEGMCECVLVGMCAGRSVCVEGCGYNTEHEICTYLFFFLLRVSLQPLGYLNVPKHLPDTMHMIRYGADQVSHHDCNTLHTTPSYVPRACQTSSGGSRGPGWWGVHDDQSRVG